VEDKPPLAVTALNGIQHVGLIAINLVYPLLIFRAVGTPVALIGDMLAIGMLVLGVGTFLQAMTRGPVGSGYMCPTTFTATYLAPSLLAAKFGGLPLVFGMTIFAGALEIAIAPALNRLRAVFPPEISGLVILMIGLSGGIAGLRSILGQNVVPMSHTEWLVGAATLAVMIALNVWGTGIVRMLCALIGLVLGYAAAGAAGLFDGAMAQAVGNSDFVGLPSLAHLSWSFDIAFVAPFAIASVAAAMKATGVITICQRMNDADWVRPDLNSTRRGVLADGVTAVLAGLTGTVGTNTSSMNVGLAAATGVASRTVAVTVAAIFILLTFLPKLTMLLAVMPRAVVVSALLFAVTFVIINGIQVINSRLLDARRTLVIGLSVVAGVAVEVFPGIAAAAPAPIAPLIGSSLVFSTAIALVLNLLFRLGVRKTARLGIQYGEFVPQRIDDFFQENCATWGTRPDVARRATFGAIQLVEAVIENCWRTGPLLIEASFDEFNMDIQLSYEGPLLEFPDRRPSVEQLRDSEDAARLLAGFMLRRNADRIRSESKDGKALVRFHFDH
jgi:NCS2 family nucleobase:cation symporter-2